MEHARGVDVAQRLQELVGDDAGVARRQGRLARVDDRVEVAVAEPRHEEDVVGLRPAERVVDREHVAVAQGVEEAQLAGEAPALRQVLEGAHDLLDGDLAARRPVHGFDDDAVRARARGPRQIVALPGIEGRRVRPPPRRRLARAEELAQVALLLARHRLLFGPARDRPSEERAPELAVRGELAPEHDRGEVLRGRAVGEQHDGPPGDLHAARRRELQSFEDAVRVLAREEAELPTAELGVDVAPPEAEPPSFCQSSADRRLVVVGALVDVGDVRVGAEAPPAPPVLVVLVLPDRHHGARRPRAARRG